MPSVAAQTVPVDTRTPVQTSATVSNPEGADQLIYVGGDLYGFRANDLLPIVVSIAVDEDGSYIVTSRDTGIFGTGPTVSDGLRDLHAALWDHFTVLSEDDALSAGLQEQLTFLSQHLRRG